MNSVQYFEHFFMEDFKILGERFSKYLKYKGLGVNKAGSIVGETGGQISNITSGKNFGCDKMYNILNIFKDLDANFLFRGTGEMVVDGNPYDEPTNQFAEDLISMQRQLIEYKDREIQSLNKQISELKKGTEQDYNYSRVAEDPPKLK